MKIVLLTLRWYHKIPIKERKGGIVQFLRSLVFRGRLKIKVGRKLLSAHFKNNFMQIRKSKMKCCKGRFFEQFLVRVFKFNYVSSKLRHSDKLMSLIAHAIHGQFGLIFNQLRPFYKAMGSKKTRHLRCHLLTSWKNVQRCAFEWEECLIALCTQ